MRVLVWDFDGTLASREGGWTGTLCEILAERAPTLLTRRSELRAVLQSGFPWHASELPHTHIIEAGQWWEAMIPTFERAFRAAGADATQAASFARSVRAQYCAPRCYTVYSDVAEVLGSLSQQGWSHIILSNHVPELEEIVHALGLDRYFTRIVTSALMGYEKPNPEAFASAITGLGNIEDVWMIGDSVRADVVGAEQFGWKAILVRGSDPAAHRSTENLSGVPGIVSSPR